MLILARKYDEEIVLVTPHEEIIVKVVGTGTERVRVGVLASRDVKIYRREVWERIKQERESDGECSGDR